MTVAQTCLILRSMEALELGKWPCLSRLSSQQEQDQRVGQDCSDSGGATSLSFLMACPGTVSSGTRGLITLYRIPGTTTLRI